MLNMLEEEDKALTQRNRKPDDFIHNRSNYKNKKCTYS